MAESARPQQSQVSFIASGIAYFGRLYAKIGCEVLLAQKIGAQCTEYWWMHRQLTIKTFFVFILLLHQRHNRGRYVGGSYIPIAHRMHSCRHCRVSTTDNKNTLSLGYSKAWLDHCLHWTLQNISVDWLKYGIGDPWNCIRLAHAASCRLKHSSLDSLLLVRRMYFMSTWTY